MSVVLRRFRGSVQLLALVLVCACGADSRSQESTVTSSQQPIEQSTARVGNYVLNSKGWKRDDFQIEFNRREGATLVFWVLHVTDKDSRVPGAGKSIEVYVDPSSGKILKELAFQ